MQNARKDAGLEVEDRIALTLGGDDELLGGRRASTSSSIAGETLATSVELRRRRRRAAQLATIEGRELRIGVERV